jgi:hypothetical protein
MNPAVIGASALRQFEMNALALVALLVARLGVAHLHALSSAAEAADSVPAASDTAMAECGSRGAMPEPRTRRRVLDLGVAADEAREA